MNPIRTSVVACVFSYVAVVVAVAAPAPPEVVRPPGSTTAQAVGMLHTLRNIPEACVRLEGLFTGDAAQPYRIEILPGDRCVQRALYVDAGDLPVAPSLATHWLLNDRIEVPLADVPACVATVEIWRKPGVAAPPKLDAQGRARIYLDKPQTTDGLPRFSARLTVSAACKAAQKGG